MATTLLHDLMNKEAEVYVDDMIIKSKQGDEHVPTLRNSFPSLRKCKRLDPQKRAFGVTSKKLLRYMVNLKRIEVNPSKIKVI